jgi:hypothetical protein
MESRALDIVEADHGDIGGNPQPGFLESSHGADGRNIVEGEQPREGPILRQQLLSIGITPGPSRPPGAKSAVCLKALKTGGEIRNPPRCPGPLLLGSVWFAGSNPAADRPRGAGDSRGA